MEGTEEGGPKKMVGSSAMKSVLGRFDNARLVEWQFFDVDLPAYLIML